MVTFKFNAITNAHWFPREYWQIFAHRIARSYKEVEGKKKEVAIVEKSNTVAQINVFIVHLIGGEDKEEALYS